MGYLKCKECGDKYKLKAGESPEDFNVCHCGGEVEYHLSSNELKKRHADVPSDISQEEIEKKKARDKKLFHIILIISVLIILIIPVAIATILIYRAYYQYPMP